MSEVPVPAAGPDLLDEEFPAKRAKFPRQYDGFPVAEVPFELPRSSISNELTVAGFARSTSISHD